MRITLEELEKRGACKKALAAFGSIHWCKEGGWSGEWDYQTQLGFIRSPLGFYYGWLLNEGLIPRLPMDGENFSDEDLSRVNFGGASLVGAQFLRSRLVGTGFHGCDLRGARFDKADLTRAVFRGALLEGASFEGVVR